MSIKQQEDETLRLNIACFNKEALSIDEVDDKILVAALTNGLWKRKFLFSLYKNDPKTRCALSSHQVHERRRHTTGPRGKTQEEG